MQQNDKIACDQFRRELFLDGIIHDPDSRMTPLTGGVSSDIYLVEDDDKRLVAKRALAKLRVKEHWTAEVSRNRVEMECLKIVGSLLPNVAPKLIFAQPNKDYFIMEYMDERFVNWKQMLLNGRCLDMHARLAGATLGALHQRTWGMEELSDKLGKWEDFQQLRVSPYFDILADKHPGLTRTLTARIDYLRKSPQKSLVHGDYSPKNILFRESQLVVLDWEVAWFGEPSFDIAFLLNHLLLKAVYLKQLAEKFVGMALVAWQSYAGQLGAGKVNLIKSTVPAILPMLMLARVDGKSPVEYLNHEEDKESVRRFSMNTILSPPPDVETLCRSFENYVKDLSHANQ